MEICYDLTHFNAKINIQNWTRTRLELDNAELDKKSIESRALVWTEALARVTTPFINKSQLILQQFTFCSPSPSAQDSDLSSDESSSYGITGTTLQRHHQKQVAKNVAKTTHHHEDTVTLIHAETLPEKATDDVSDLHRDQGQGDARVTYANPLVSSSFSFIRLEPTSSCL